MKAKELYGEIIKTIEREKQEIIIKLKGTTVEELKYLVELKKLK